MTEPHTCPRWERCGAPLCPLDAAWQRRKMLSGEPVCLYLRELAKPDGSGTLARFLPPEMLDRITTAAPAMIATAGPLRRELKRAAAKPSRLAQFLDRQREPQHGP